METREVVCGSCGTKSRSFEVDITRSAEQIISVIREKTYYEICVDRGGLICPLCQDSVVK